MSMSRIRDASIQIMLWQDNNPPKATILRAVENSVLKKIDTLL
jgi:hypothetical protein